MGHRLAAGCTRFVNSEVRISCASRWVSIDSWCFYDLLQVVQYTYFEIKFR